MHRAASSTQEKGGEKDDEKSICKDQENYLHYESVLHFSSSFFLANLFRIFFGFKKYLKMRKREMKKKLFYSLVWLESIFLASRMIKKKKTKMRINN